MVNCHILLVSFPSQGHINPSLQFAKRLLRLGINVTFCTSRSVTSHFSDIASTILGLTVASFSDGYDNGWTSADDVSKYMLSLKTHGSKAITDIITGKENVGPPITHVVYSTLITWAGEVANKFHMPSTLLWNQPASVFYVYYLYANEIVDFKGDSREDIELPGLPLLFSSCDLPTFMQSSCPAIYKFALPSLKGHFDALDQIKTRQKVLVNTIDELELDTIRAISKYDLMGIGPLIPSAFLDENDPTDKSFGGDLIRTTVDYTSWLNSRDNLSIIYVAFGSFVKLPKQQIEEIAKGLIKTRRPFLWVIRDGVKCKDDNLQILMKEAEKHGMIVPWCSQLEVLSHPSVGCFFTHSGWNSCIESLSMGVPTVAFPQWGDQPMNAKVALDYWRTGLRVEVSGDEGLVMVDEIVRYLEVVMGGGEKAQDMRKQAQKWKKLAKEAVQENGSSNVNLKIFSDQIVGLNLNQSL